MISTVDPEARHVRKSRSQRRDGYKAHVAIEPGTGLFTGEQLTRASGEDNHEAGGRRWPCWPARTPG